MFDCLTDRSLTPRYAEQQGNKAETERLVVTLPESELREMLRAARALD